MIYKIYIQGLLELKANTLGEALKEARLKVINENATNLEYVIEEEKNGRVLVR